MATGSIEIQYPLAGLNRRAAYQQQPPYSSVSMMNVRSLDTFEKRARGGSRPMLAKEYSSLVGSATDEVRMLGVISGVPGQPISATYGPHAFTGANGDPVAAETWDTPTGYNTQTIQSNMAAEADTDPSGNILKADEITDMDTTRPYTLKAKFVVPGTGSGVRAYALYGRMDTATPVFAGANSVRLYVGCFPGAGEITTSVYLDEYYSQDVSGNTLYDSLNLPAAGTYYMVLRFDLTGVTYFIQDSTQTTTYSTGTMPYFYSCTGHRVGFKLGPATSDTHPQMDDFQVDYYTTATSLANTLVAWSKDQLVYSVSGGTLSAGTIGSLTLGTDKVIQCVDRAGVLYIADTDNRTVYSAGGTLKNGATDYLQWSGATYSNYNAADYRVEILATSDAGELPIGQYAIASVHSTNGIELAGISVTSDRTCTFKIARSPKKFTLSNHTLSVWTATKGSVPLGAEQLCRYRDSMVFSNFPEAPHMSAMSRIGDPTDWDYGGDEDDTGRAVVITDAEAGDIGEPIMATIPGGDDYLFYGCRKSCWVMIGDIRAGGGIFNRSREIGIASRTAWCPGPEGEIFFIGSDGMYIINPLQTYPQNVSVNTIPAELVGLDSSVKTLLMTYDSYGGGVHIYLSDTVATAASTHFWYDRSCKCFSPVSMPMAMEPTAIVRYPEILARSGVVLGCRDGYLRTFRETATTDDGQTLSSYVWIGPIRIAPIGYEGTIDELVGVLDDASGDVTWSIHVGESMESALAATARTTGTWSAGRNHVVRPRERGHALFVKLSATTRWALEGIGAQLRTLGKLRPR